MLAATLSRAARAIAPDRNKLTRALAQLRGLVDELAKREKFLTDAITLLSSRLAVYREREGALSGALRGDNIAEVQAALAELDAGPTHTELLNGYLRQIQAYQSERILRDVFLHERPEARSVLEAVCKLRLDEARAELRRITQDEQQRLDAVGEFSATDSPVVKRAASHVASLEAMFQKITTTTDIATTWSSYAEHLLGDE